MAIFRALAKPIPAVKVNHKQLLFMITEDLLKKQLDVEFTFRKYYFYELSVWIRI